MSTRTKWVLFALIVLTALVYRGPSMGLVLCHD